MNRQRGKASMYMQKELCQGLCLNGKEERAVLYIYTFEPCLSQND